MVAHATMSLGWTWDYVLDHMDFPRLEALNTYWAKHPPVHIMVAAYFGIGKETTKTKEIPDDALAALGLT